MAGYGRMEGCQDNGRMAGYGRMEGLKEGRIWRG